MKVEEAIEEALRSLPDPNEASADVKPPIAATVPTTNGSSKETPATNGSASTQPETNGNHVDNAEELEADVVEDMDSALCGLADEVAESR